MKHTLLALAVITIPVQANIAPFDFSKLQPTTIESLACKPMDNLGVVECNGQYSDGSTRKWYLKQNKQGQVQRYKQYPINSLIKPVPFGTK